MVGLPYAIIDNIKQVANINKMYSITQQCSPDTLPLPLAAFGNLIITYKLDKASEWFPNLAQTAASQSCFAVTLGLSASPISRRGSIGPLLGHGLSHFYEIACGNKVRKAKDGMSYGQVSHQQQ
ncbi:hypothetical protein Nepgr_010227 [Nepenthes gracilis]|uniref:Uncharacterized protein n=1 Tax=Nepenthes gracilis TaxID=150966 RepID=A0AAD3SD06_NEPGR|nr:hypothetical protein Nepgr_010227 [Nepenthes gracilis]